MTRQRGPEDAESKHGAGGSELGPTADENEDGLNEKEDGLNSEESAEDFDLDEVLAKYDLESSFRRLAGIAGRLIALALIAFSLFQLYTAAFGVFDARIQRAIHLAFGMSLTFLLFPARKGGSRKTLPWWDVLLGLAAAAVPLYMVVYYHDIVMRAGLPTTTDIAVAT